MPQAECSNNFCLPKSICELDAIKLVDFAAIMLLERKFVEKRQ